MKQASGSLAAATFKFDQADEILLNEEFEMHEKDTESKTEEGLTPNKLDSNLLNLLSNLEGLTPAGLEHLMETQDKLAKTSHVNSEKTAQEGTTK